ncbi:MAG TPA: acyl-CoA dehydrogenase family protein [Pseudonocardiaceae bacterium]
MPYPALAEVHRLEHHLGDPSDPQTVFSYRRCLALDDDEQFPAEICRQLEDFGLQHYYVPARHGGRLADYDTSIQLVRALARRDLTVAIGHSASYLGAVCVWVAGNAAQGLRLASIIGAGEPVAWALTEREHGSDLLAGEVRAIRTGIGYRLTGEKWLINNAIRSSTLCVLARTRDEGGPRGFSLFLVEKARVPAGGVRWLPKVPTHGIRGVDVSGFRLERVKVTSANMIGPEGSGLETVLKALQLTRTLCAALSVGGTDHALRLAMRVADRREVSGCCLLEAPWMATTLAECYADHLLAEAFCVVAGRAIQTLTPELSVIAAAIKYVLPVRAEAMIARLRRLLGPRVLLAGGPEGGMFGKVERDHRIVSLFDGNTLVNLTTLIGQFPLLVRAREAGRPPAAGLRTCCELSQNLPDGDLGRLSLVATRGCSLLLALPAAVEELTALRRSEPELDSVADAARRLDAAVGTLHRLMDQLPPARLDMPPVAFDLAGRLATAMAGAAALLLWLRNRDAAARRGSVTAALWCHGGWLHACLSRVLVALGDSSHIQRVPHDVLLHVLGRQVASGVAPSLFSSPQPDGELR